MNAAEVLGWIVLGMMLGSALGYTFALWRSLDD